MGDKTQQSSRAWSLARRQHDVLTREELLALGFSDKAIKHRLERGRLHRTPWRGVYAVGRPNLTRPGFLIAAVKACGDEAALSHFSAAELWGIARQRAGAVHVTTPRSRRGKQGIQLHRRADIATTTRKGIPVTTPVETLIDLTAAGGNVEAAVNEADKLGVIGVEALRRALDHVDPRPGVTKLARMIDIATFIYTDTELERAFVPIALRAGLPKPRGQYWIKKKRYDFYFEELGIVVETDGGTFHRTPFQQTADRRGEHAAYLADLLPLRFTHGQIRYAPAEVEAVLSAAGSSRAAWAAQRQSALAAS